MKSLAWTVGICLWCFAVILLARLIHFCREQVKREREAMKRHVNFIPDAAGPRDSTCPFARPPASKAEIEWQEQERWSR